MKLAPSCYSVFQIGRPSGGLVFITRAVELTQCSGRLAAAAGLALHCAPDCVVHITGCIVHITGCSGHGAREKCTAVAHDWIAVREGVTVRKKYVAGEAKV